MDTDPLAERVKEFAEYLEKVIRRQRSRATRNHWIGVFLMALAISSSAFAGIAGLTGKLDSRIVGAVALVPGFIALLGSTLKFDTRAMWHFRKKRMMQGLLRRLRYELPPVLTAEQLAEFSTDFTRIDEEIDSLYEKEFTLNWGLIGDRSKSHK